MRSILLVEDSKLLRLDSETALVRAVYSVASTDDGEQALREAQEHIPYLVLLDMLLPKLGGPEVLYALKRNHCYGPNSRGRIEQSLAKSETKLKRDGATAYFEKSKLHLDTDFHAL